MTRFTSIARTASSLATAPLQIGAAILGSPSAARRDPSATRLRTRRQAGWAAREVVVEPGRTSVLIERGSERDEVVGETLAFSAYAARVAAAAGVPLRRAR